MGNGTNAVPKEMRRAGLDRQEDDREGGRHSHHVVDLLFAGDVNHRTG
jgi:hypothetical protein